MAEIQDGTITRTHSDCGCGMLVGEGPVLARYSRIAIDRWPVGATHNSKSSSGPSRRSRGSALPARQRANHFRRALPHQTLHSGAIRIGLYCLHAQSSLCLRRFGC
jgi:hypothetical protein